MKTKIYSVLLFCLLLFTQIFSFTLLNAQQKDTPDSDKFEGRHYYGRGDVEYLKLLEIARRMFEPDPEFQNIPMLYNQTWNSFVEGPTWAAWWIQNSYGTTYCALPFYIEPYRTFLQNAQDFWFDLMGDGKRKGMFKWQAPDGALCDCACPDWIIYKQGDGKTEVHDWGIGFATAGVVLQSELLLINHDIQAVKYYLPKLERTANFLESRRDPKNNLFLAGPAGNLLAPSYAGWHKPDGTYDKAYLAEISINYIAGLDRLIELEKMAGKQDKVKLYTQRREAAKKGLPNIMTDEGYFLRSIDPDGVKHGVFGAEKYGYFETTPNHDAICFRVVNEAQANKIYDKIASIPQLRPHSLIIPNYPRYDDMYEKEVSIWKYGHWVNGGHWSTCEARMMMAYSILGKYEDMRKSMLKIMEFAKIFRMDNNLPDFGNTVYQPKEPINITYDAFAIPAALTRGLFEYIYKANDLTLIPHIPTGITELQQLDPVKFGKKELYLSIAGNGEITSVTINGKKWVSFDKKTISLPYGKLPDSASIVIMTNNGKPDFLKVDYAKARANTPRSFFYAMRNVSKPFSDFKYKVIRFYDFYHKLEAEGMGDTYEAAHAKLVCETFAARYKRMKMIDNGELQKLPEVSQIAADTLYYQTAERHCNSLEVTIRSYRNSANPQQKKMFEIYQAIRSDYPDQEPVKK
jgi:hypothetical protein